MRKKNILGICTNSEMDHYVDFIMEGEEIEIDAPVKQTKWWKKLFHI